MNFKKIDSKLGRNAFQVLIVIVVSSVLTTVAVFAWSEPSAVPPGSNVSAPLNIGSVSQYKSGALGVGGVFHGYSTGIFDGSVGIGTIAPGAKLEVKAGAEGQGGAREAIRIWGPNTPANSNSAQDLNWSFAAAGSSKIRAYRGGSWDTYLQFLTNSMDRGSDNPQVRLHIDQTGRIGMGTTNPGDKLHIFTGPTPSYGSAGGISIADTYYVARLYDSTGGPDTGVLDLFSQGVLSARISANGNSYLVGGNVGIGTYDPASFRLNVSGDANANRLCIAGDCRSSWPGGGGDITAVNAGSGLAGGGQSGDVNLSVNFSTVQARTQGVCPRGSAIRAISRYGDLTCETVGSVSGPGPGTGTESDPVWTSWRDNDRTLNGHLTVNNGYVWVPNGTVYAQDFYSYSASGPSTFSQVSGWMNQSVRTDAGPTFAGLTVNGSVRGTRFIDDDPSYYVDSNTGSNMNYITLNSINGLRLGSNYRITSAPYNDGWARLLNVNDDNYVGDGGRNAGFAATNLWAKNDIYLGAKGGWLADIWPALSDQKFIAGSFQPATCLNRGNSARVQFPVSFPSQVIAVLPDLNSGGDWRYRDIDNTGFTLYSVLGSGGCADQLFSYVAFGVVEQ